MGTVSKGLDTICIASCLLPSLLQAWMWYGESILYIFDNMCLVDFIFVLDQWLVS